MSPLRTSKCLDMYSLASHFRQSAVDYIDDLSSIEFFWWKKKVGLNNGFFWNSVYDGWMRAVGISEKEHLPSNFSFSLCYYFW